MESATFFFPTTADERTFRSSGSNKLFKMPLKDAKSFQSQCGNISYTEVGWFIYVLSNFGQLHALLVKLCIVNIVCYLESYNIKKNNL